MAAPTNPDQSTFTQNAQTAPLETPPVASPAEKPVEEKTLYSWKAPSRPFKRRDREFWTTVIAIAGVFGLILFLIEGVMPVILIISLIFLFYVLSTVPPEEVEHKITTYGFRLAEQLTPWENITRYWFTERFGIKIIVFETITIPGRLEFVAENAEKEVLKKTLDKYVAEEEAPLTSYDKMAGWLSQRAPQEK